MRNELAQLMLSVDASRGADNEESVELARHLRQRLLELDVDKVELLSSGLPPRSAKGDPLTLPALAVTLAPAAITALIGMLQSWLSRHQAASVTVEKGGEKLTITGTLSQQQQRMVEAFLNRRAE
jgi:hypothetical protein